MPHYNALRVSLDNGATWHILTDVLITTSSDWLRTSHITITATGSVVAAAWPVPASMDETTLRAGMDAARMTVPFNTHTFYPQHDAILRMIGTSLADERLSAPIALLIPLSRPEDYRAVNDRGGYRHYDERGSYRCYDEQGSDPLARTTVTGTNLYGETIIETIWRGTLLSQDSIERQAAYIAEREAADAAQTARGRDLLQTILTANQWSCFERHDYVEVWGKQIPRGARRPRRYRLFNSLYQQTIAQINGVWCEQYCLAPNSSITNEDALAARVLLLRNDERAFRRTANRTPYHDHTSRR